MLPKKIKGVTRAIFRFRGGPILLAPRVSTKKSKVLPEFGVFHTKMWKNRPLVDRIPEKFSTSAGRDFFGEKLLLGDAFGGEKKRARTRQISSGPSGKKKGRSRRRPTFPPWGSIIGAWGLDFRVRNGNGYFPPAMATGIKKKQHESPGKKVRRKGNDNMAKPHDLLVPLGCARRRACTCGLSTW